MTSKLYKVFIFKIPWKKFEIHKVHLCKIYSVAEAKKCDGNYIPEVMYCHYYHDSVPPHNAFQFQAKSINL